FDLDSKSTEDERPCNFSDKNVPENSSNNEKKHQSADQLSDSAHKTQLSIGDRDNIPENNKKKNYLTMAQREHSQGNYLTNDNSDNNQYFCLPSSGDGSAEVVLPEIKTASTPFDADKPREIMKKHGSIQPISSSPSMSSSPVDSYNSGCWTKASENELPNPGIVLQNQSQGPITGISGSLTGSIQITKDANNSTGPKKSIEGVKNIDEKQNQCQKLKLPPEKQNSRENLILPPLKREITFGGSAKLRGLISSGLQSKAISKLEDNIAQQFPALISKPFNSTLEARTKTTHASSTTNES
ncbi:uncharacterized protein LOC110035246, partial [Phalaenopsis equestris]|uniref:uncharacterized protein LOC110035246 n=1 Tax=Phalaenopsis equestris TaxID=78828 RepID=UPI0009E498DA